MVLVLSSCLEIGGIRVFWVVAYWHKSKEPTCKSLIFWSLDIAWVPPSMQVRGIYFQPVLSSLRRKS